MITEIIPFILVYAFIKAIKFILNKKSYKYFKEEQPDMLLQFTQRGANGGSDSSVITVANLALAYVYYGMYDSAERQISIIDWEKKPNRLKSFERRYQAIVQYLKYQNFDYGAELAIESKKLGKHNLGKNSYNLIIQIGMLLNGNLDTNEISVLERKFKSNKYIVMKLLIAWALANTYMAQNQIDKSKQYLDYCKELAPYCYPFQNIFMKTDETISS